MTFNPSIWFRIAVVLSIANLAAVGVLAGSAGPAHLLGHAVLAAGFGVWAQRLRNRKNESEDEGEELPAGLEALEIEVDKLRQELSDTQERLDFAERMLAQRPEPPRVSPER